MKGRIENKTYHSGIANPTDEAKRSPIERLVMCVACGSENTATANDIKGEKQDKGIIVESFGIDIVCCKDCDHVETSI